MADLQHAEETSSTGDVISIHRRAALSSLRFSVLVPADERFLDRIIAMVNPRSGWMNSERKGNGSDPATEVRRWILMLISWSGLESETMKKSKWSRDMEEELNTINDDNRFDGVVYIQFLVALLIPNNFPIN